MLIFVPAGGEGEMNEPPDGENKLSGSLLLSISTLGLVED